MTMNEKRMAKYPDTKYFHFHNANPKGKITTDCVFRAISTALEQDYNRTVMEMAQMMCDTGVNINDRKMIDLYLKSKGWKKMKQPRDFDNKKLSGEDFCAINSCSFNNKNIVANIGTHHVVAIVNNKVNDIWNSSYEKIGSYWVKED